jgi:hypothetical protein
MTTTSDLNRQLDDMLATGSILEAFEKFYADDVVMQENDDSPTQGKDANRAREIAFVESIETYHGGDLLGTATTGDVSYSEWFTDVTLKEYGRVQRTQVAKRHWKDGKIVNERFYYKA